MYLTSPSGRTMVIHKAFIRQKLLEGWKPSTKADINIVTGNVIDAKEVPIKEVEAPSQEVPEVVEEAPKKRGRKSKKED